MTNSLQDLIDASIFISTEYQARLAELVGTSEWNVDFTSQSLDFETTPPLSLKPHLLGTESENRGTWIWSWQQLGYFPDSVVSAAIQARETGERDGLAELTTDELPLSESLARRLTLATKTISGLYAHYPLPAGAGVRAWTLLEGAELTLEAPTYKGIGRVIAKTLQSEEVHNQVLAVDSYAQQRGFHIAWDTEATAVLTATDGALRLAEIERVAAAEAAAQNAQREQEAAERAAARAEAEAERAAEIAEHAPVAETEVAGVESTENLYPADEAPFDQDPAEHAEPGLVTVETLPGEYEAEETEQARVYTDESIGTEQPEYEAVEASVEYAEEPAAAEPVAEQPVEVEQQAAEYEEQHVEPIRNAGAAPDLQAEHEEAARREQEEAARREAEQPKKKGFFSRFFGL